MTEIVRWCARAVFLFSGFALLCQPVATLGAESEFPLLQRQWLQVRTLHFSIYSCGPTQEIARVAARLEQFRNAYSMLAGAEAVASPPIVVIAFPNHASMRPFLPLYQGKPANLAAFFHRGSDENFIALYLSGDGATSLENVFHEYTHLLLRHNQLFWPLWLNEGMAEIYSTFELTPDGGVKVGKPIEHYLQMLSRKPLIPLADLFAVANGSPEYNERDRQGMFYAESWLLTHYLMLGDNAANKARFGHLTTLLRQGQAPEQAFTNSFGVTLRQMENQLRRYLERGHFETLRFAVKGSLASPVALGTRIAYPVEVSFRLGDMLLRVKRPDEARLYFERGQKIAPKSPMPLEGLGLLAIEQGVLTQAVKYFRDAMQLGSVSFLAHYNYARAKLGMTAKSDDKFATVDPTLAEEIKGELQKSLASMPDFGPAHELLGFFLLVQNEELPVAERHLQLAIQLEPENQSYLFTLAQLQWRRDNLEEARRTLEPLRLSYTDSRLRAHAEEMLRDMSREPSRR